VCGVPIALDHVTALAESEGLPLDMLNCLMGSPALYIYGGLLKRLIDPASTVPVGDVDVIALNFGVMQVMTARFGIKFRKVNTPGTLLTYFIGKAGSGNSKIIHLVLMHSHEQALRYLMNNQFDIDRIAFSNHEFFFDPRCGLEPICTAIRAKRATRVGGPRDLHFFAKKRPQIERHYAARLRLKGYEVAD
jgi:hypothetical protein